MRIGFLQYQVLFGQPEANRRKVTSLLGEAQFDLLVLPELCFSGYYMPSREIALELAEPFATGESFEFIRALARKHDGAVVYGFPERSGDKVFNSAALVCPDGTSRLYRKTHLFNLEKHWFDPGDTGFAVHEFRGARIGLMICFDWRFPESARTLMLKGADIICHPSNLVMAHCQDAMVTRCLENGVFAVTCNRTGADQQGTEEISFTGRSQITGRKGEILSRATATEDLLSIVEIDPATARDKAVNALNDMVYDRQVKYYFN
jgi:predicted amidohydrolase